MYIFKSALKTITRSKGRNLLIGIIALVIAVSACLALSIREAAVKAKANTLASMTVTAQIGVNRQSLMSGGKGGFDPSSGEKPDRATMAQALQGGSALSLDELQTYAAADAVSGFYYTVTSSADASNGIEPVDATGSYTADTGSQAQAAPGGRSDKGFGGMMGSQGDFTLVGYSSEAAMTDFVSGTNTVTAGAIFDLASDAPQCAVTDELATYNSLAVGDTVTLANPNNADETFTLTICAIYHVASADTGDTFSLSTATDSANRILMSVPALQSLLDTSAAGATETTDSSTGRTTSTALASQLTGTYVFDTVENYEAFSAQAAALGLNTDTYSVTSKDLSAFESGMVPLESLSTMATYFLLVVFAIGAIILVVLNIFNIRERKYEIGVLTAIGMKKAKVALQFTLELFIVMFAAILIGAGIGAAASVPVTNALLSNQIASNTASVQTAQQSFGREVNDLPSDMTGKGDLIRGGVQNAGATNYISEISYSTNLTVLAQLIGVGILLTLISSLAAVTFIMRYEPLKILTNRE